MFHDESRDLLIKNSTYLDAIQNASVTVYNLGFENLQYQTGRVLSDRDRSLKAIIPKDDQVSFLERVDKTMKHHFVHCRKRRNMLRYSMSLNQALTIEELKVLQEARRGKIKTINPKHGIPVARPLRRIVEMTEQAKKDEQTQSKSKKHLQRMSEQYDILRNGEKYVYGPNDNLIPAVQYDHIIEEKIAQEKLEKARKQSEYEQQVKQKSSGPVKVELWNKTIKHVEKLRSITTIRKEYPSWTPGKYPDSTLPLSFDHEVLPPQVIRPWPEVGMLCPGDLLISIEHCAGCAYHDEYTQHQEEQYQQVAKQVVDALRDTAYRYAVRFFAILKPIQSRDALDVAAPPVIEFQKGSSDSPTPAAHHADSSSGKQQKFITVSHLDLHLRIGAFEVQAALCVDKDAYQHIHEHHHDSIDSPSDSNSSKNTHNNSSNHNSNNQSGSKGEVIQHVLFSKLCRGAWPSIIRLRERLEALLDLNSVPRLVAGSTVHHKPRVKSARSNKPSSPMMKRKNSASSDCLKLPVVLPSAGFDHRHGLSHSSTIRSVAHTPQLPPEQPPQQHHHQPEPSSSQHHGDLERKYSFQHPEPPAASTSATVTTEEHHHHPPRHVAFASSPVITTTKILSPKAVPAIQGSCFEDYQQKPVKTVASDESKPKVDDHNHHSRISIQQIADLPHNTTDRVLEEVKLGLTPRQILHELLETAVDEDEGLNAPSLYEVSLSTGTERMNSMPNVLLAAIEDNEHAEEKHDDKHQDDDDDYDDHHQVGSLNRRNSDLIHMSRSTVRQTLLNLQNELNDDDDNEGLDEPSATADVDDFWKRPELTGGDLSASMVKAMAED